PDRPGRSGDAGARTGGGRTRLSVALPAYDPLPTVADEAHAMANGGADIVFATTVADIEARKRDD
ncbi:hypothetical protein, partial [Amycolatopsis sp. H20-H5]|uniref:hypothetical protein n=1 Tax=Amycolatopsis sp. H20-H5 TaxID=3046309 RepID=UPI002DBB62FF